MANASIIEVKNVSKSFRLPHERTTSVKSVVLGMFRKKRFETQRALKDVSFDIRPGEFFGIVGRNGSGKSTLLKMLAGIYAPTTGHIGVKGKLTPFIELGVGFNPELTGRENVFLNGALLGFSRKEMTAMYDDIVAFAELERFMDQKLKNYSSGMQVRLAFSVAIRASSDILLIDEVLAVGDAAFQKKCFEYFIDLKKKNKTVVLVTHDMAAVERFCDRAMVVDGGVSHGVMTPAKATVMYSKLNAEHEETTDKAPRPSNRWGTGKVKLKSIKVKSPAGGKNGVMNGEKLALELETTAKTDQDIVIGLAFIDQYGVNISGPNSKGKRFKSNASVAYEVAKLPLAPGSYSVTVAIFDSEVIEEFDHYEKALTLNVSAKQEMHGKVSLFGTWSQ